MGATKFLILTYSRLWTLVLGVRVSSFLSICSANVDAPWQSGSVPWTCQNDLSTGPVQGPRQLVLRVAGWQRAHPLTSEAESWFEEQRSLPLLAAEFHVGYIYTKIWWFWCGGSIQKYRNRLAIMKHLCCGPTKGHDFQQMIFPQKFLYSGAITWINRPWAAGCTGWQQDEARDCSVLQHIFQSEAVWMLPLEVGDWTQATRHSRGSCCLKFVVSNSLLGPFNLCNIHCPSSNIFLESEKCCTIGRRPARKGEKK